MKCLSLKPEDHGYFQVNAATWYCVKFTSELFPFNHFVDDDTFVLEANQIDVGTTAVESIAELIFNPFKLNGDANYYPLSDIEPDANFVSEFDYHLGFNCNHFEDSVFDKLVKKFPNMYGDKVCSLCHMKIKSLKANLSAFQACLDNIKLQFSAIGISETWLS